MFYHKHLLLLISIGYLGETANILALFPYPFYGHIVNFIPIFKELAMRGHNVTLVSPFPQKESVSNLTEIVVPNLADEIMAVASEDPLDWGILSYQLIGVLDLGIHAAKTVLNMEEIKRLIADKDSKFDLIITETWCLYEPFIAFGHKFNATVINTLSLFLFPRAAYLTGNHLPTTYVPVTVYFAFNDRMSFIERIQNSLYYYWDVFICNLYYLKRQDTVMREHFIYPGSENLPPLEEMLRNTALTLLEHDLGVGYPVPLHRNVVPFSGVNLKEPEKLPQELQSYLDDSKDGVIYFSLGSFFAMNALKPYMQQAITSALGKLKHKLIMKLNDQNLFGNINVSHILIRSWLPQREILAHPNCKLFVTHGGLHGTMEGVYHGVPMVGIPLIADQRHNVKFIETTGLGIGLDIYTITEENILNAIEEVFSNPKYRDNAKKRSTILKDTPMNTMDNLIYWIENVIRHKGAPHLRPAVLDLHWYQHLMLDVISFFLFLILLLIYIIKTVLSLLFKCLRYLFCRKTYKKLKKSKKE